MSTSPIAKQPLVMFSDEFKMAVCYVPLLGDIVSSSCHADISNRLARAYKTTTGNLNGSVAEKLEKNIVSLLKLQKQYEDVDGTRNLISGGLLMTSAFFGLVGTAMKVLSVASLLKTLFVALTFAAMNFSQIEQSNAKQKENAALTDVLQEFGKRA